jgi:hypothetical protein
MAPRKKTSGRAKGKNTGTRKKGGQSVRSKRHDAARKVAPARAGRAQRGKKASTKPVASATTLSATPANDLPQLTFEALTAILAPYMNQFEAYLNPSQGFCLRAYGVGTDEIHFAGVQWMSEKLYFHLFPLQRHPELREQIAPDLRARLEGEWSFCFERIEPELFEQLAELTAKAFERIQSEGLAPPLGAA